MVLDKPSGNNNRSFGQPGYRYSNLPAELENLIDYFKLNLSDPLNEADYVINELIGDYFSHYNLSESQKIVNVTKLEELIETKLNGHNEINFLAGGISPSKELQQKLDYLFNTELHLKLDTIVRQVNDLESFILGRIDEYYQIKDPKPDEDIKRRAGVEVGNLVNYFWGQFKNMAIGFIEQFDKFPEEEKKSCGIRLLPITYSEFLIATQKVLHFGDVSQKNPLRDINRLVGEFKQILMYNCDNLRVPLKKENPFFYEGMRHALIEISGEVTGLINKENAGIEDIITMERYEKYLDLFISNIAIANYLIRPNYSSLNLVEVVGKLKNHKDQLKSKLNYTMPTQNVPIGLPDQL